MTHFRQKPGAKAAFRDLKKPIPDLTTFNAIVRSLLMSNPLGCISYWNRKKNHRTVEVVREMYKAKFVYKDEKGKRGGADIYNPVEGYENGIAAVISNMANITSHGGKVKHIPDTDLFSVTLKCHDPDGELYFLSLARNRVTTSSYTDERINKKVEQWADTVPALA